MEVVSMAAEIYASAAGTIAQIWILSELFPRKQSVKKVYIVGWILLNFCIAHFVLLPNLLTVAAWHGCDAFDVVYPA